MTEIRPILEADHSSIFTMVTDLSDWFDADARKRSIPIGLHHQQGFVAEEGGQIIGFITPFVAEGRLNIGWLGVRKHCQRKGVGGLLLDIAEETARDKNICWPPIIPWGIVWIIYHMNKPELSILSMASESTKGAKQITRVALRKLRFQKELPNKCVEQTA